MTTPSAWEELDSLCIKALCCFIKGLLIIHETIFVNFVFRVQYKFTVVILLSLSLAIAVRQSLWSSMNCKSDDNSGYVNDICYTLPPYSSVEVVNPDIPFPGIVERPEGNRVYHHYYPWVSSVLFLQAVLFFVPWYFWRTVEARRVRDVVKELKDPSKKKFHAISYEIVHSAQNYSYMLFFFVTDILNILNVIGQIFLMDSFLEGNFMTYGSDVTKKPEGIHIINPNPTDSGMGLMLRVFPREAMCQYKTYGASGDIQNHKTRCSLPLNVLYQRIYLFLWFYFIVLASMACFALVYHILLLLIPPLRRVLLGLQTRLDAKSAKSVTRTLDLGAWFYLYNLSNNLNSFSRRQLNVFLRENIANEKSGSIELDDF